MISRKSRKPAPAASACTRDGSGVGFLVLLPCSLPGAGARGGSPVVPGRRGRVLERGIRCGGGPGGVWSVKLVLFGGELWAPLCWLSHAEAWFSQCSGASASGKHLVELHLLFLDVFFKCLLVGLSVFRCFFVGFCCFPGSFSVVLVVFFGSFLVLFWCFFRWFSYVL